MSLDPKEAEFIDDSPAWRVRSGELVEISKMTDAHLLNTILHLRRCHDANAWRMVQIATSLGMDDDMGGADEGVAGYDRSGPENTTHQAYTRLLEEALARGLKLAKGVPAPETKPAPEADRCILGHGTQSAIAEHTDPHRAG